MQTADFLATVPLHSRIERGELQRLAALTRERQYAKGSVILFENDPGDALFIVRQGRVKVVLVGEDGREVILGVLGPGEYFGELSLIDEQPRSAQRRLPPPRRSHAGNGLVDAPRTVAPTASRRWEDRRPRPARRPRAHR